MRFKRLLRCWGVRLPMGGAGGAEVYSLHSSAPVGHHT